MQEQKPQPQVVVVKSAKSVGIAIMLTIFFGPIGMFYSTIAGAFLMIVASVVVGVVGTLILSAELHNISLDFALSFMISQVGLWNVLTYYRGTLFMIWGGLAI